MPFASELTRALHESGITQATLSELTGSTQPDLSKLARGVRLVGPDLLKKIVKAFPEQYRASLLKAWVEDNLMEFGDAAAPLQVVIGKKAQRDPLASFDPERRGIIEWVTRAVCDPRLLPMLRVLWRNFEGTTAPEGKSSTSSKARRKP